MKFFTFTALLTSLVFTSAAHATCGAGSFIGGAAYITSFGADPTGAADSTQAIQDAIDCAHAWGVTQIVVPNGNFQISGLFNAQNGLKLYPHMTLVGQGPSNSKLFAAPGQLVSNFVQASGTGFLTVTGIAFVGNSSQLNNNSAINFSNDQGSTADVYGITITNNTFENFQAQCWICVTNYSADVGTDTVNISNNTFTSQPGNAYQPENIGRAASAIWIQGSKNTPHPTSAHPSAGVLTNTTIQSNTFIIPHIKNAISLWSGVNTATVSSNTMTGVGNASSIPDNVGAYAVLVYNNAYYFDSNGNVVVTGGLLPDQIFIQNNTMTGVHSAGVYAASPNYIRVTGNSISDQYDSQDVTIPKAAIALNQPKSAYVGQNTIRNSLYGLELVERSDYPTAITVQDANIFSTRAGGTGIKYQSYTGDVLQISNAYISLPNGGTPMAWLNGLNPTGTLQFSAIYTSTSDSGPWTQIY